MTSLRDLLAAWDTWRAVLREDRPPRFAEDNAWERLSALFETVRKETAAPPSRPLGRLMATELEWACKTAMTAVGGEW